MKINTSDVNKEKMIDFKKVLAIIQKNFIVMTRDKARLIPLMIFPVLMILVFGYISGNIPKHISATIIAYDTSSMSEEIQQKIAASNIFSIRHVVSTEGEAKKLLDSGETSVIIEIPAHLQEDINNGIQTGITIIVDESDSSIGNAAKQTLNAIINQISFTISMQKVISFQKSVGVAANKLEGDATQQINNYGKIASLLAPTEYSLTESSKLAENYAHTLIYSLPLSVLQVLPSAEYTITNENTSFRVESPTAAALKAQISLFQQFSDLVGSAGKSIQSALLLAKKTDKVTMSSTDYQSVNNNIVKPMMTINLFTNSQAEAILKPLVYEEKPAYGTGKRAVDFLIPSIIALIIFQGAVMGMGRAVAGEKREGSLTRVFLTPTSNATIIIGTLSFYIIFELFRSAFIILVSMLFFNIKIEGSLLLIGLILIIYAGISTSIGMIFSSMVKSEQQYTAMAMLVSMPTMFLSGALFPVQAMPNFMQTIAKFLPVTYGGDALRGVMIKGFSIGLIWYQLMILFIFLTVLMTLVFMVFKRDIE